ncbi:MAG: S-layer homology domain-containing protein [Candidatus Gracilibacteria bacterium]|nr:S-layer homology domain-containing protein [Candidatus Gracilibacteria bacterium]
MKKRFELIAFAVAALAGAAVAKKLNQKPKGSGQLVAKNGAPIKPVRFVSRPIHQPRERDFWMSFWQKRSKPILIVLGLVLASLLFQSTLEKYGQFFRTSMLELEVPVEFTGTTMPIKKVPNWVDLSDAERRMTYDQIPTEKFIPLPPYNLSLMKAGQVWRRDNKYERNVYLTYPVPNLGNYELDATEESGSHTGVDIKTPVGTPVHAIASGVVIKAENQPTGFGQHIVIAHVDIPDPGNPAEKTTLYSAYAHLSQRLVSVGNKVTKGQIIAKTGMSGMATAPHLHFQVDRKGAPFHPYWPFTWKDLQAYNISSYFEAVKQGIGLTRAKEYTFHPMLLASTFTRYENPNRMVASAGTPDQPIEETLEEKTETETPAESVTEEWTDEVEETVVTSERNTETTFERKPRILRKPVYKNRITTVARTTPIRRGSAQRETAPVKQYAEPIEIEADGIFVPGVEKKVIIRVNDPTLVASAGMLLTSTLENFASISPARLDADDFVNGEAEISVISDSQANFRLIVQGDFGEVKSNTLRARMYSDLEETHPAYEAIEFLKNNGIITGYADGTFRPKTTLNRAEAVKLLIEANELRLLPAEVLFSDVPQNSWYTPYVKTALARDLVRGYADNTFRPGKTISRAEFLKIAIEAANIPLDHPVAAPYADTPLGQWFTPYFDVAKRKELFDTGSKNIAAPARPITRAEAAEILYNLLLTQR